MQHENFCHIGKYRHETERVDFPCILVNYGRGGVHTDDAIEQWEKLFLERRVFADHAWFTVMSDQSTYGGTRKKMVSLPEQQTLDTIADEFRPDLHIGARATLEQEKIFREGLTPTNGLWSLIIDGNPQWCITADFRDGFIFEKKDRKAKQ